MKIESDSTLSVNVLWDGGATVSLITFDMANQLQLKGRRCKLSITGVGGGTKCINSYAYVLMLRDVYGGMQQFTVYCIERISSEIKVVNIKGVLNLIENLKEEEVSRPSGPVHVLIGYEYAAIHPVVQEASGNLVLLVNKFGKCLGGSHPRLYEETYKGNFSVHHVSIDARIEDFCRIEALGITSSPACGNCRCGKCLIGSHNYSL